MARRTTALSKGRNKTKPAAPVDLHEPATVKAPRRARNSKLPEEPPAEMPPIEAFLPAGEEPASVVAAPGSEAPGKARRVRKAKSQPAAEPEPMPDDTAPPTPSPRKPRQARAAKVETPPSASPSAEPTPAATPSPAAQWNAETGTVTFDWPAIEQVAAAGGANQAMAKLLLAARAEGANSRWPF